MMNKRILTIVLPWRLVRRELRSRWRRDYTVPPGAVYSTAPQPYPPGGYPPTIAAARARRISTLG